MPQAINTYIHAGSFARDKAKSNVGGLGNPGTLIEQGDMPVNVEDLKMYGEMEYPMVDDDYMDGYVSTTKSGADITEGVSLTRSMYQHEMIRKNSDY